MQLLGALSENRVYLEGVGRSFLKLQRRGERVRVKKWNLMFALYLCVIDCSDMEIVLIRVAKTIVDLGEQ